MEQVKDSVGVDPDIAASWRGVGLVAHGVSELANWGWRHLLLLFFDVFGCTLPSFPSNSLSNVDAGFSSVTGLTRIEDIVAILDNSV